MKFLRSRFDVAHLEKLLRTKKVDYWWNQAIWRVCSAPSGGYCKTESSHETSEQLAANASGKYSPAITWWKRRREFIAKLFGITGSAPNQIPCEQNRVKVIREPVNLNQNKHVIKGKKRRTFGARRDA